MYYVSGPKPKTNALSGIPSYAKKLLVTSQHESIYTPGAPPYKKQGSHRKSYMVMYENIEVIESTIKIYGKMQVIKRSYCSMNPCNSYTVP